MGGGHTPPAQLALSTYDTFTPEHTVGMRFRNVLFYPSHQP